MAWLHDRRNAPPFPRPQAPKTEGSGRRARCGTSRLTPDGTGMWHLGARLAKGTHHLGAKGGPGRSLVVRATATRRHRLTLFLRPRGRPPAGKTWDDEKKAYV
eukprot:scaffold34643_cov62-Phaeocystis_antarctica.AAC.12